MSLKKTDIYDLTTNLIETKIEEASFLRYQDKTYLFTIGHSTKVPFNFLYIRVALNRKTIFCTLKSVYSRQLIGFKTVVFPDGVFNKICPLLNSDPNNPYYPSEHRYFFSPSYESYKNAITQIINDYKLAGRKFFDYTPKHQTIISKGLKYIDDLAIPPKKLAHILHQEIKKNGFVTSCEITHPIYKELVTYLTPFWNTISFEHLPLYMHKSLRQPYCFAFHLLYFYIRDHIKNPDPKILYMFFQLKE